MVQAADQEFDGGWLDGPPDRVGITSKVAAIVFAVMVLAITVSLTVSLLWLIWRGPAEKERVPFMPPKTAVVATVLAGAASPNGVSEVRCDGRKASIQAELDNLHDLRLFIGSDALGWSFQHTGSTSVTATVEASSQIKMEDGSMGRGLIFQAWGSRAYIAITPEGPVPYGEVVFRQNSRITNDNGNFTFADIRQSDGTLVPVSIRVRPVSGKSSGISSFGPVIERVIATADADDQGLVFFDLDAGKSFKPPFPLTFYPNQGPAFVELTPELKQWIQARDVDFLLHLGEKNWDLMTLEMQEGFAGQLKDWETISPDKVIGVFAKKDVEHLVREEVPASSFGHSYRDGFGSFNAFRTRSTTLGVYQFEGVDNSTRRGVGLRYKLVQAASSAPAGKLPVGTEEKMPPPPAPQPGVKVEFRRAENQPGEGLIETSLAGAAQKVFLHSSADARTTTSRRHGPPWITSKSPSSRSHSRRKGRRKWRS